MIEPATDVGPTSAHGVEGDQLAVGQGPPLVSPTIMSQFWADISFVHWRVEPEVLVPFMPPGARPALHDGSAWVGLLPFRMQSAGFGPGPAVPFFGTFWETNVRLYSTDAKGRPGVVFLSLEAQRLLVVLGARAALNVPYYWARMTGSSNAGPSREGATGAPGTGSDEGVQMNYGSRRLRPHGVRSCRELPVSALTVEVGAPIPSPSDTDVFLSARFGLHTQIAGRGVWVPNTHRPWPLRSATVVQLSDQLVAATGLPDLPGLREPDHVMFSRGVHTRFGFPQFT